MAERPQSVYDDLYDLDDEDLDISERLEIRRTDWSLQRTLWSAERTLNSWIRTAMTAVVAGLAIVHFIQPTTDRWAVSLVAAVFAISGLTMYAYGLARYRRELAKLQREGVDATPPVAMIAIVGPLLLAAVITLVFIATRSW